MFIPIELECEQISPKKTVATAALLDSGAGGVFLDADFARKHNFPLHQIDTPMAVFNVDGTRNTKGTITHATRINLKIADRIIPTEFLITGLGKLDAILGFSWLTRENPIIDWKTGTISFTEEEETLGTITHADQPPNISINAKMSHSITFAQQHLSKEPPKPLEEMIPPTFHDYLKVFSETAANRFPETKPWDHKIDLKEGFSPRPTKIYPLTQEEEHLTQEFINDNLKKGYIRQSESPMASPFFFVHKADGKKRPCQDYRYLNEWTVKNAYPLPLISDIMDKLKGAKYFTKLDVRWGYNNVRIRQGDEWKAAFKTKFGLFEPTVMFFGLCNSPATFQAMMDHIFTDPVHQGYVIIYMDDILIFAKTKEDLEKYTKEVLKILQKNDLYLKPEKCEFEQTKVKYLGFVIEEGQVTMDPIKVQGITEWPAPQNIKQLRSFLGFGNFYRKFIRKYADIARPLNELLRKDTPFIWTQETDKSFNTLKKRFTEEPVLAMPDITRPFQIEADASKYASGAVLTQLDMNGDRHPVAFLSKSFAPNERNYEIYDRELLAIIRALGEWRHYVQGSPHATVIYSDHKNLTYYRTPQRLTPRQARWRLILSEYNLQLVHLPGTKMILSDSLSRRPDLCPEEDHDNEDITMLPDMLFTRVIDTTLLEQIATVTDLDKEVTDALQTLQEKGSTQIKKDLIDWEVEHLEGKPVVFRNGRQYIPIDINIRRELVNRFHNLQTAGHPGELETYNAIREHYWWPGQSRFVKEYVKGCAQCQQFKINRRPTKPALMPIEGPTSLKPFAQCAMDFITDLPPSEGYDSIMVVVDHGLTKGVILMPCNKTITAEDTAKLLLHNLYKRFGLPDKMISDRGPQFAAKSFRELLRLLGITSSLSTAYHPQSDGTTERFNQEIEAFLGIYCCNNPNDWVQALPFLEFTHNNRRHSDRPQTPFELIMGIAPTAIPLTFQHTKFPDVRERLDLLNAIRHEALAAHELARQRMVTRIQGKEPPFKVNDQVWLDSRNLKMFYASKKLAPRRQGPFKIIEAMGPVTYRLQLPPTWKIHNVFHATLLSPYKETTTYGPNFPQPPPDIIEGEEEHEVEAILNHRRNRRRTEYFVKWKGYSDSDRTWEPEGHLKHAKKLLDAYKAKL